MDNSTSEVLLPPTLREGAAQAAAGVWRPTGHGAAQRPGLPHAVRLEHQYPIGPAAQGCQPGLRKDEGKLAADGNPPEDATADRRPDLTQL